MSNPEFAGTPFANFEIPDDPSTLVEQEARLMATLMRQIRANMLRLNINPRQPQFFSVYLNGGWKDLFTVGKDVEYSNGPIRLSQRIIVNNHETGQFDGAPRVIVDDYIVPRDGDGILHVKSAITVKHGDGDSDVFDVQPTSGPFIQREGARATIYQGLNYENEILPSHHLDYYDAPASRDLLMVLETMSPSCRDDVISFSYATTS